MTWAIATSRFELARTMLHRAQNQILCALLASRMCREMKKADVVQQNQHTLSFYIQLFDEHAVGEIMTMMMRTT